MNKKVLIAGTRLTGEKMHLGTYYGWIYQIKRAQKHHNVIIIICDYQSLDNDYDKSYYEVALDLKKYLKCFLPDVPIIIESDIKDILKLGFLIQKNFKPRYYKRIMPIRKQVEEIKKIKLHTLLYPSMMLADIYALNAEVMFNKPEGKFQHSEVINNMIHDLNVKYNFNYPLMSIFGKQLINILSLDGTGPMKRNRASHGLIEINNITEKYIYNSLRISTKEVVKSIADSINYLYDDNKIMDEKFLLKFSHKILLDLEPSDNRIFMDEDKILLYANERVQNIIRKMEEYEKNNIDIS